MIQEIRVKENQKQTIPLVWTGNEQELNYSIALAGRGADVTLLILLQGKENNTVSIKTNIFHQKPDTKSRVIVKGALSDKSRVDFQGTVKIEPGATGSKAWLAAHLLLLDSASGIAVPNMEILENEVVAGHAATVGRLNDLELFYLMSRGLSEKQARELIIHGFLQSLIEEFPATVAEKAKKGTQMANRNIKKDFPIFTNYPNLVYLDSAATSQKPKTVIDTVTDFYTKYNSNVHRGIYDLSEKATEIYEGSRQKVANFIGTKSAKEIIFTGNASEAINLAAFGYARKYLKKGDIIVTTEMEHHSNIVPWFRLKKDLGIKLLFLPIDKNFELDYGKIVSSGISKNKVKLVCLTHASNVLGTVNPITKIIKFLKENGIKAKVLVDAAQSIPHLPIDVKKLGCDFLAFSSHKMLGPSGLGVLWAKEELLESMDPLFVGSHMISAVTQKKATWANLPDKFEVGTGHLEAVAGLGAAIDYLQNLSPNFIENQEQVLTKYALNALSQLDNIILYGKKEPTNRLGVFSFNIKGVHPHDTSDILNRSGICVRAGHHCAQPLMNVLKVFGTVRASLYIYNTREDIDKLIEELKKTQKILRI